MKKIFLSLCLVLSIILFTGGCDLEESNNETIVEKHKYELVGGEVGEYGKEITLNANTDLPAKKILYKIPAGTYKVTTTYEKLSAFWIVKDNVVKTGPQEYPEELEYVGNQYSLTAGDNDFNGMASKEVEITINNDESINLTSPGSVYIFEEE